MDERTLALLVAFVVLGGFITIPEKATAEDKKVTIANFGAVRFDPAVHD